VQDLRGRHGRPGGIDGRVTGPWSALERDASSSRCPEVAGRPVPRDQFRGGRIREAGCEKATHPGARGRCNRTEMSSPAVAYRISPLASIAQILGLRRLASGPLAIWLL